MPCAQDMPRSFRAFFTAMLALVLAWPLTRLSAQPRDVHPVLTGESALSLNGRWQFKYTAGSDLGADTAFSASEFPDATWASIAVPGHWELQGFAEPKYARVEEGTGLYRRTFRVPAKWEGQRVFIHFDGVLYGFDVWVNGTKAGSWASAYNPVAFEITDALKPGGENVLAVQVTTRSLGFDFDVNDCWALSGIYRDVTLFAVPAVHFTGFTTDTKLQPDGSAILNLTASASGGGPEMVRGILRAPDGKVVREFEFASSARTALSIEHPQLWTAETPVLYTLELALTSGQRVSEKIGLREITIKDAVLQLNGQPIKLRGIDHHDIWPANGRVATEELMRRDLALIRAANINFIRTSHYPPHPRFLELCDELGFYVMDEVPFGFGDSHLTDEAYRETLLVRARATVGRDRNHASVIVWSVGNENPNTPLTIATARRTKELDPTRPVCFPQIGSYFAKSFPELPDDIDIYAPHYPSTATVKDYAARLTRPVIFTEYAHALGLAADQVQAQWAIMQASPRIAGGAIWMFQDQGILRTATATQTPATSHELGLAVWPDATHYYDTSGNGGMDGIVYSDRTPQPDYWEVRKVYSPVQIAGRSLTWHAGSNSLTLPVENRFDFRTLEGMTLTWSLRRNGAEVKAGSLPLHAAAHRTETVELKVEGPADLDANFTWLETHVLNERNESLQDRSIQLKPALSAHPSVASTLLKQPPTGQLALQESADAFTIVHPQFNLSLNRATGEIKLRDAAGVELATGFQPHAGRRFTEGEFVRAKRELTWTGAVLPAAAGVNTIATQAANGITFHVRGRYPRPDAPEQALEGELNLLVTTNGAIEIAYDYVPTNSHGLLLEAGLAMTVPATASEFQWAGDGPYAGYPGKDVLNEFGLFHLNREDLYFQGNRGAVELAMLTSPNGAGVLLLPEQPADIAVENTPAGTVFSHNALLSGRGTKFVSPDTSVQAESSPHITGKFTLLPLTADWPAALTKWFGAPSATKAFHPFHHSYDQ